MNTYHPARPPIVAGVDGSTSALHATRWAAREATRRKLPLRVVHACPAQAVRHPTTLADQNEYLDALAHPGRHWIREATAAARSAAPGVEIVARLRVGHPATVLADESAGARVVVLGSGESPGILVGSVALTLAEHGPSPIVVVRGHTADDPPPDTGPVLVGVDGSPASEAAVEFAFDAASIRATGLIALHTWSEVSFDGAWTAVGLAANWHVVAERERRLLDERMAGWQEKYPDVPVRKLVLRDRPVRALLDVAERTGAQLIVVGARGLAGVVSGMGMGSTSRALLRESECPVAVVRPGSPERTDR